MSFGEINTIATLYFTDWISQTRVSVDGGSYVGFLKSDGSFTVNDIPAGSYVVEVLSPNNLFEPVRVDISGRAKGKIRARKVNFLQNSAVVTVPYPLKLKAKEPAPFFEKREQWKVTDMLFNPMVSELENKNGKFRACQNVPANERLGIKRSCGAVSVNQELRVKSRIFENNCFTS